MVLCAMADVRTTDVSVVIPFYNEEDTLPTLFFKLNLLLKMGSLTRYRLRFILVDDGSDDATGDILDATYRDQPDFRIIHHPENRGFGAALRTGLDAADGDLVVTIDADSNYNHLAIFKILDWMKDGVDVVTASPFYPGGKWHYPAHRFIFSITAGMAYRFVLGNGIPRLYTYTSGFRVYRRTALKEIMPTASDFTATAEVLVRALIRGFRVSEYPTIVYPRAFGYSKLKTMRTTWAHLKLLWKVFRRQL